MTPTTEPMTTGEIARLIESLTGTLHRIETKIDAKPDKDALNIIRQSITDLKADQIRKDEDQDKAIQDVESRLDRLLFGVIGSAIAGVTGILVALSGAGVNP